MRWMTDDRGAVGIMVALMMIPLLVCTALVVDVGSAYARRTELQTAADAAALGIAQDCGQGACGNIGSTATSLTSSNVRSGAATASATLSGNSVTVHTLSVVDYLFAPVIGIDNGTVGARATANWGAPVGGRSVLPVIFSWCAFYQQTHGGIPSPTSQSIQFSKEDSTNCTGPSGNVVPGGFGWLKTDSGGGCKVTSSVTGIVHSDPGSSAPCSDSYFTAQLNRTVLLPLFEKHGGTGTNAWYQVYAYAAFRLTGFHFQGSHNWLNGYFLVFVAPSDAWRYGAGAPDLGARVVSLTG